MLCNHTIHKHHHHFGWDNAIEPILTVTPGETVEIETIDASAGQVGPDTTLEQFLKRDCSRVNPVTGPIYIEGAEPGDAVAVTFKAFQPSGWGWTANIPGFGLLADQFTEPALHIWKYDAQTLAPALFGPGGAVPLRPFCGTVGLAPAEPGAHSVIPPRRVGGNLDIRDNAVGTTLYLPVEVAGGLLSLGDTHCGSRRRGGVRHRYREPHGRRGRDRPDQAGQFCFSALRDERACFAPPRRGRLLGRDRGGAGSDAGGPGRRFEHGRLALRADKYERGGRVHAVQRLRRSSDQRDR